MLNCVFVLNAVFHNRLPPTVTSERISSNSYLFILYFLQHKAWKTQKCQPVLLLGLFTGLRLSLSHTEAEEVRATCSVVLFPLQVRLKPRGYITARYNTGKGSPYFVLEGSLGP